MEISQISINISFTDDKGNTQSQSFRPVINLPPRTINTPVDNQGKIEEEPIRDISDLSDEEFNNYIEHGNEKEKPENTDTK